MVSQSSSRSSQTGAKTMAELMAAYKTAPVVALTKGDIVKGRLTKLSRKEILVDINAKGEAVVLEKDPKILRTILSLLQEGQEVEVSILNPESESGQPVVSLRRFIDNVLWKQLEDLKKSQKKVDVVINEVTKGGFVVSTPDGLTGFLPHSHTVASQGPLLVGKTISVSIVDLNREDNKIIFSQKTTMSPEEFASSVTGFSIGSKVRGEISSVTNFGYFVLLHPQGSEKTIDGLIHISELTWERLDDPMGLFTVGDEVEAVVIGIDKDSRRVDLSIKRLTVDPFEKLREQFPIEKEVLGKVLRLEDGNVFLDLGEGVEGVIKKEKVPPTTRYTVGSTINAVVSSHDTRRRRIELVPVLLAKPIGYR